MFSMEAQSISAGLCICYQGNEVVGKRADTNDCMATPVKRRKRLRYKAQVTPLIQSRTQAPMVKFSENYRSSDIVSDYGD
jgi:hypothetical protein